MRKPATYINVALVIVLVWLAAGFRSAWRENHSRYAAMTASAPAAGKLKTGLSTTPGAAGGPATVGYAELVTQNLFSPDRNNDQPVIRAEKKPKPPTPVVIGTLNLGSGMVALMAEPQKAALGTFRRLKVGEEVGGYRVVEIAEHKVVIDFEGETTAIDVYESAESVRSAAGGASYSPPAAPAASGPAGPQVTTAVPSAPPPPAAQSQPAPTTVSGTAIPNSGGVSFTIEGNRKKFQRPTPWGVQTWYEDIPPAPRP